MAFVLVGALAGAALGGVGGLALGGLTGAALGGLAGGLTGGVVGGLLGWGSYGRRYPVFVMPYYQPQYYLYPAFHSFSRPAYYAPSIFGY